MMDRQSCSSGDLAAAITKDASKQTYYTILFFADREHAADAFRAYGYFRWVDDVIDAEAPFGDEPGSDTQKITFARRQKSLLESCYRGEEPSILYPEERILVDLVRNDTKKNSGLQIYLRNMMDIMVFDATRRGRYISQGELADYSNKLAKAVTEALYYFIGHDEPTPCHEARYLAVTAAHITHMLRDMLEDTNNGYFNIPGEVLTTRGFTLQDITSPAYREWVCDRVKLARRYFTAGRECTARVKNWRCRMAGYAYIARFEWMLDAIEADNYCLRADYSQRKNLTTGLWIGWSMFTSMLASIRIKNEPHKLASQPVQMDKR